MSELFSVLIPTRDRCETLGSTIASCLVEDRDELRVIVSDNCSIDATRDVVEQFRDPRLTYLKTDRRRSMSGNFEFSLNAVKTGYVMHLGDDDALIPGAIAHVTALARETRALAITSAHATYHWPNTLYSNYKNRLTLPIARGFRVRRALEVAARVANFRESYPALPSTYSGFVHRSVIDRVMNGGSYYTSITPDSFSGFVNSGVLQDYVFSHRPFALAGLSGRSNGASQITNADDREASKYVQENDLPVHPDIVYCRQSLPIVVAEAFLQARVKVGSLGDIPFDFITLCRVALAEATPQNYAVVREAVETIAQRHNLSVAIPAKPSLAQRMYRDTVRLRQRVGRLGQGYRRIDAAKHGVVDVAGAARLAAELLGPFRN